MARWSRWQDLVVPLGVIAGVLLLLVPLTPALLDLFLALSLAVSVIVLLTAIYIKSPLDFSVFPSVLLATTVGRLVLNVASTRLILTRAATDGVDAAGGVIREFAAFVTGDQLIVGIVLFAIIFTIQFVVITKGATRIGEVAARFALDGLPGRQMAIDADVQAGLIDQAEAQRRRQEVSRQAEFYGAMDGAGKFVRGDAVAALVIVGVNIVGGVLLGLLEYKMPLGQVLGIFSRLTIGDGLVNQIPALLISLAAGLVVTRSGHRSDLSQDLFGQLFAHSRVLLIAGLFLLLLIGTNLPTVPLALLGMGCISLSFLLRQRESKSNANSNSTASHAATGNATNATANATARTEAARPREERIEDYLAVDPLEVELGMRLLRLADPQRGGDLLRRVTGVRQKIAGEMGVVLPKVRIRDNLKLSERSYRIRIANNVVAQGTLHNDKLLAIDVGQVTGKLAGEETLDPTTGQPAVWITAVQRERAEALGYVILEPAAVVAAHLQETVRQHSDELLTRDAAKHLIDELRKTAPAVVDELVPGLLRLAEVQQVLQLLLREEVPIRQLSLILETLGDHAPRTRDPRLLAEQVRRRLARTLMAQYRDRDQRLYVVTLDPALEDQLFSTLDPDADDGSLQLAPTAIESLCEGLAERLRLLTRVQRPAVVLVSARVRSALRRLVAGRLPRVAVLCYEEITPDTRIESVGIVAETNSVLATR